uniref:ETS proto-onco 1, transcription factor n=1 Tax=Taeniopygia guttata TaxID=59729 RepID=H0YQQ4_TAEGU
MKAAVDLTIIKTEKVDIELFPSPDMECADVPLLTPSSKEMMSQALKATFSGFAKEQQRLGIPKDPQQWTETHVRDWVMWAVNEFSLKEVDFQKFCMNGAALCALGKECFLELAPDFVGDILWEHLEILQKEEVKPYPANGVNTTYPESRYTSDYFISYGIEHAQCVPPSEFSEPSFITESYQTLHPISSEELLSLKYESDYPAVLLREPPQDALQSDFFSIKQEVVTPDNMCMGRASRGKLGGQDSFESIESYDSCDRLTQSWSSQSSFQSLQRVPSYDSFDSEDYPATLPSHKPKGTFKDYVRDRADMNKDKPVIPAAALAGYTGRAPSWEHLCAPQSLGEHLPIPRARLWGTLGCPSSLWGEGGFWGVWGQPRASHSSWGMWHLAGRGALSAWFSICPWLALEELGLVWFLSRRCCSASSPCAGHWWGSWWWFPPGAGAASSPALLLSLWHREAGMGLYLGVRQGWGAARAIPNIFHSLGWER